MSSSCDLLKLKPADAFKMLACDVHNGGFNVNFQLQQYVYKRRNDGNHIVKIDYTWEKLMLAARVIAAVETPSDVVVVSSRPTAQRAVLKFAAHTGASAIVGRFTPGTFTNYMTKNFKEPRLLIVTDPLLDHQAVTEASFVNLPVISFVAPDSPMRFIDIGIPCNNKGTKSIGLLWWFLARQVLILRGRIPVKTDFILDEKLIMPDLYFHREDLDKEEKKPLDKKQQAEPFSPEEFPEEPDMIAVPTDVDWTVAGWENTGPTATATTTAWASGGNTSGWN